MAQISARDQMMSPEGCLAPMIDHGRDMDGSCFASELSLRTCEAKAAHVAGGRVHIQSLSEMFYAH